MNAFYTNVTRLPILVSIIHMICIIAIMFIHYSITHGSSSDTTTLFWIQNSVFISSFTSLFLLLLAPYYFLMYPKDTIYEKLLVGVAFITSVGYFVIG